MASVRDVLAGPGVTFETYEGADHAFDNPDFHLHHPEASALAWERTTAFLGRHLPTSLTRRDMREVLVPPQRLGRWVENFGTRHGDVALSTDDGALVGGATDGSRFVAHPPFARSYDGPADVSSFVEDCVPPDAWGVLLVRKGGFAVARLSGETVLDSKVGQRHVQGRTKAGGQSQQRFARRRDNQARVAYEAAADHAARILPRSRRSRHGR